MKTTLLTSLLLVGATLLPLPTEAQEKKPAELEKQLEYGARRLGKRQDPAMQRFREQRFGAFIHWGLYAIPGGEWKGKTFKGAAEWLAANVPTSEWMQLREQWNPIHYDPVKWAKMFKQMGVKYVKITTKHHEGFCLWPSKYTDKTIAHTPYKKDLIGPLVKALNDEGIDIHFYFSFLDWSHPDYRSKIRSKEDAEAFKRFLEFTENQLRELCTLYPTVKDFWFDGTWEESLKQNGWWTAKCEKMLKELIPGVTVNSRLRADDLGSRHFDSNGHLMGDYESGYERRLPDPEKDLRVTTWDWEGVMTVPENQWGYHKDWTLSYVKTPQEVLEYVVHAVSMGGNEVVNFGPKADGTFRAEELELATWLGQWMKKNGTCIYGCDYAGLKKQPWGYFTKNKEGKIFMIIFNLPCSRRCRVDVPKGLQIKKAVMLGSDKELKVCQKWNTCYNICLPDKLSEGPWVIELTTEKSGNADTNKYQVPHT